MILSYVKGLEDLMGVDERVYEEGEVFGRMKRLLGIRTRSGIFRMCRFCRFNTGCVAVTRGVLRRAAHTE